MYSYYTKSIESDILEFTYDLEDYDSDRKISFGSVYHQINLQTKFEDCLLIRGKLIKKTPYSILEHESNKNKITKDIELTCINDNSIRTDYTGTIKDLKLEEIYIVDLGAYGYREIKKIEN